MRPMNEEPIEPTEPTEPTEAPMEEPSGLDGIIERVDSYISDPKLVTPETLMELKSELEDLKSYLDEDSGEETEEPTEEGKGGLSITIGKMRGNK